MSLENNQAGASTSNHTAINLNYFYQFLYTIRSNPPDDEKVKHFQIEGAEEGSLA